ncbi:citrate lyase holo-[acyl-carrier protein] synthase [Vibrio astriarenae]|uniref:citrate lyase holo-[acyl-carrier protein] synthase n=1 Tax=Vibrio astriarenae TaxID=1481923 RepID=UPI0037364FC9
MSKNKHPLDQCHNAWQHTDQQQKWIKQYRLPLLRVTTFVPRIMANSEVAEKIYSIAKQQVHDTLSQSNYKVIESDSFEDKDGKGLLMAISGASSTQLKRAMIKLENNHPLGPLFNFDVLNRDGKMVSRRSSEMEPRKCIICDHAASYCAASHIHSEESLEREVLQLLGRHLVSFSTKETEIA